MILRDTWAEQTPVLWEGLNFNSDVESAEQFLESNFTPWPVRIPRVTLVHERRAAGKPAEIACVAMQPFLRQQGETNAWRFLSRQQKKSGYKKVQFLHIKGILQLSVASLAVHKHKKLLM